jgi:hypothetical protein
MRITARTTLLLGRYNPFYSIHARAIKLQLPRRGPCNKSAMSISGFQLNQSVNRLIYPVVVMMYPYLISSPGGTGGLADADHGAHGAAVGEVQLHPLR